MPRDKSKASKKASNVETTYCPILELLAFSIHPGTTENTTTIFLSKTQGRLFVTSQANLNFSTLSSDYTDVIDALMTLKKKIGKKGFDTAAAREEFWDKQCKISDKAENAPSKKADEKYKNIKDGLYKKLFDSVIKKPQSDLAEIKKNIILVRSVVNSDIFQWTTETTGFHGESRIIRYLYIGFVQSKISTVTGTTEEKRKKIATLFSEWTRTQDLLAGSSQGTCKGCGSCLDAYSIKHGNIGNAPKQWLNPITMNGTQGTTQINKDLRHHAFFQATNLANLQINHEFTDDEDVW